MQVMVYTLKTARKFRTEEREVGILCVGGGLESLPQLLSSNPRRLLLILRTADSSEET